MRAGFYAVASPSGQLGYAVAVNRHEELVSAIGDLLNCPELNFDELEPETRVVIEEAQRLLESIQKGIKKFRVRYARIVIMETDVEARREREVKDTGLPGVFEGIDKIPPHVREVLAHDQIWDVGFEIF